MPIPPHKPGSNNETSADLELHLPNSDLGPGSRKELNNVPDLEDTRSSRSVSEGNTNATSHIFTNENNAEDIERMGLGEQSGMKWEGRNGDEFARNLALTGVVLLVVPTWLAVLFNNPLSLGWYAFHPLLQTLALACFTYGIITLQPTSQPRTKAAGFSRHQTAILYVGFPSILFGTSAVSYNKWLRGAYHITSWHGTFGLICMLWLLFQMFLGAGSVWYKGTLFGGGMKAKAVWKYHRMSGYILFPLMLFTAHLGGGWSRWGENNIYGLFRFVFYVIGPVLILTGIYMRVRLSKMKFW